ncbi:MAG TPA: leucine--tRNA ligase [Candidatus Dormibacteraeota bacterium]|nr:leucine--tRNA ligase [Candidatus Dormibacteraeota bacterium]
MAVNWAEIDKRWQAEWAEARIFEADPDPKRKKCFVTFPFPYMSGPLHVGSGFTAARIDAYARYMRMLGFNVLFPWAWHWTGKTVAGAAERIKNGDEAYIRPIREVDEVPEEDLKKFVDPVYMAQYYTSVNRDAIKRFGTSVDWRREFHTSSWNPEFSKFVTWQYLRLREKGYVTTGTHPVVWCPKDQSPTGDHDRLEGEGVRPEEFVLMKFKMGNYFLPCATFRPETIYGVTNLWINPEGDYVEASVNNEKWIVSKSATTKLQNQMKEVNVKRGMKGSELVGKKCLDPLQDRELLVLPGSFVNPDNATGLVYSVPAHAPFDWLALRDLQKNPQAAGKFGIKPDDLTEIKPISVISVPGYGEFPAIEITDRMALKDQNDPGAEEATKEIYKVEFNQGVLRDNCGPFSKQNVSTIKEGLVVDFRREGVADVFYQLPQRVVCRCTTECVAKIINQWFLKYSDPKWKALAHDAISHMVFYPEEARAWFDGIIDWLQDWPCARKTGLGTPLPWDKDWIIETLSDSTIYMAYYMVSKFVHAKRIEAAQLTPDVFDFIFFGVGKAADVGKRSGVDSKLLDEIRNEFLYWYPVDLRNSGKDLVGNHLSFFILHHVALFDPPYWPRAIGVNGFMLLEGRTIHKSKGNYIPLRKACDEFGADSVRCTVLLAGEGMDDPDWRADNVRDVQARLESFLRLVDDVAQRPKEESSNGHLESWLKGRLAFKSILIADAVENLKTRTALSLALFDLWNDLRWYERRTEKPDSPTVSSFASCWIRLLAPFAPHLSEEAWRKIGGEGFVASASWPDVEMMKGLARSDELESLIKQTLEDTQEILTTTKLSPKKVHYYTAANWKWRVYGEALSRANSNPKTLDGLIRDMLAAKVASAKDLPKYASKIVQQVKTMPSELRKRRSEIRDVDERSVLMEAAAFFRRELKTEIEVHGEEDSSLYDPKGRAKIAEPYRPAIFVE